MPVRQRSSRLHARLKPARSVVVVLLAILGLGVVAPSPEAASGPLTVSSVTWDVVGLDSNNVNVGPNVFPVGVRVCNTGSDAATNVVATWAWKTTQNAFTGPADGATVSAGTMQAGECRQVFFEVTLNRSPSSRLKARDYQITVTADGGLSTVGTQRQLYVEKLVSQNRNTTKKLAGPGGCNLAYTTCDSAAANLVVGQTYTYKFYAETSTAYSQIEAFVNFPSSVVQVISTSSTYSNPTGATSSSLYGDACGWSTTPTNRSCVGPTNIAGGKAGGRIVVTYVVRAVAPGSGTLRSTIYDFSGSSYHYNSDYQTATLLSSALTVRYGLDTTIVGNGNVTSLPSGTLTNGSSSGIDCGGTGTTCSVGYATGTSVTLTALALGTDTFVGWSGGGCSGSSLSCTVAMSQSRSVTATFTGATSYPLDVAKTGSGTVTADVGLLNCGAVCATRYDSGTVVTLTASPALGWSFAGWTGEGCSGSGTCQVTMSQARSVTATFNEQTYGLSVSTVGNGTVTSSSGTIYCGNGNSFCSDVYGAGTVVVLTATPGSGQTFTGWSGADCAGILTTCTVTMSQARAATASFSGSAIYPLEVGVSGSGSGGVTSNTGGISCSWAAATGTSGTCGATYTSGTLVTLTATATSGSSFLGWGGDCSGTSTTCVVTMSQARDVFATFGAPQTLTVTKAGSGTGTVASTPSGIGCGATCSASFAEGTVVTLTATPAAGSLFTGWTGDCTGTGSCTVTMSEVRAVTATFTTAYTLTVAKAGSGTGGVVSDVAGVDCGASCSANYSSGTVVTLTASAGSGARFSGWSGEGCSGTGTCTVTMSAARAVTATFVAVYTLTVSTTGSGSGTVSGGGIDCGLTCTAEYDSGTVVTLTATAASGSGFIGWTGACSGTGSCTVTMSQARNVTATFGTVFALSVAKGGSGTGTVTGTGIDCGATCGNDYIEGTVVTLTATAASASAFTGWSGACSGTGTCTVTLSQARSVTATFVALYSLTVAKTGSGAGGVTGGGIDCGATCTAQYQDGTSVTLIASAATGSRFTGWSGACSGSGGCTVTMDQARTVTATFVAVYSLTASKTGSGSGTVSGGEIDCGITCTAELDSGTSVTLTAVSGAGSAFTGWSGACSGTGTCIVTMSQARSVTATFVALYALTVAKDGTGAGTVSGGGIDCGLTCAADYEDGTLVTLVAIPSSGSRFTGWGGGCAGATTTCTVTMSQARSVTATFTVASGLSEGTNTTSAPTTRTHTLTVVLAGSGTGGVGGGGIDCGGACSMKLDEGTIVVLTVATARGSRFAGWSGAGCSGTHTCTVTMSQSREVTATFVARHTLTVVKAGSGSGSVMSRSVGIRCGSVCAASYDEGARVTLTATPLPGSRFAGWAGAGCSGTDACTVSLIASRRVTATFMRLVRVQVEVAGRGAVVSTNGPRCRTMCARQVEIGRRVTLSAQPRPGYWLRSWSGACHGTQPTCTVVASRARFVRAHFARELELRVRTSGGYVFHLPDERAALRVAAMWRGRPLVGAEVRIAITCPSQHVEKVLRTDRDGTVSFSFGQTMRNADRLVTCAVVVHVSAHGRSASSRHPAALRFIHPLWLEAKSSSGAVIVRIWGRRGEPVVLHVGGTPVARARIGRDGWVEVRLRPLGAGSRLWVAGAHGHHSHVVGVNHP